MGSYIYPITSTTSLLQTSPPSSLFKGEQYAVIDGNYSLNTYKHWPTNNTFHYASSDIGQIDKVCYNQRISLFNCIIPRENLSSKCNHHHHSPTNFPADVDETKLMALSKISETKNGEIYFGKFIKLTILVHNQDASFYSALLLIFHKSKRLVISKLPLFQHMFEKLLLRLC